MVKNKFFLMIFLSVCLLLSGCGSSVDSGTVIDTGNELETNNDVLEDYVDSTGDLKEESVDYDDLAVKISKCFTDTTGFEPSYFDVYQNDDSCTVDLYIEEQLDFGEINCQISYLIDADGSITDEYGAVIDLFDFQVNDTVLTQLQPAVVTFWDYPALNNISREMVIIDAMSFSEGVAWITVAESAYASEKHVMLIDTSGAVLYYDHTERGNYKYTNFAQGVSLLYKNPGNGDAEDVFIVNTEGEIIWRQNKEGISAVEKIYGDSSVEAIRVKVHTENELENFTRYPSEFNGYFVETFKINTFEKTGTFSVVIGSDGTWVSEPIELKGDRGISMQHGNCYYSYADRVLETVYSFNLFTQETSSVSMKFPSTDGIERYDNEVARWQKDYERFSQGGLLFDEDAKGFMDADGNLVIDCYEYDFRYDPVIYNGYCVLMIKNADGAPYITAVDTAGNQIFPPIKHPQSLSDWNFYGYYSDGYITLSMMDNPKFYFGTRRNGRNSYYITLDGDAIETEFYNVFPFSDGYSLACRNDHDYYFLNTDLKDAFPQTEVK